MGPNEPLQRRWSLVTVVVAVVIVFAVTGRSGGIAAGMVGLAIVLLIAFGARWLYARNRT